MFNKVKHLSIFAAAVAMAGLLLASSALAVQPEELADRCPTLVPPGSVPPGKGVVLFKVDEDGNLTALRNGGNLGSPINWPPTWQQKKVHNIQIVVGNPVICYVANGELICINY